jgi:hypothetical protein
MSKFTFLKTYLSPFKPIKPSLYIGKIAIGTPYFYPRRWIKSDKKGYLKAIPKKIGFDFVDVGWKPKWSDIDIRFEWCPVWSFVFFKWQIAILFIPEDQNAYWTTWVYYEYYTNKKASIKDRIAQCKKEFHQTWTTYSEDGKEEVDYYPLILKDKYNKQL